MSITAGNIVLVVVDDVLARSKNDTNSHLAPHVQRISQQHSNEPQLPRGWESIPSVSSKRLSIILLVSNVEIYPLYLALGIDETA